MSEAAFVQKMFLLFSALALVRFCDGFSRDTPLSNPLRFHGLWRMTSEMRSEMRE
jgi:hypothetical protein